jgi:hypothetical protein
VNPPEKSRSRQLLMSVVSALIGIAVSLALVEGIVTLLFDEPVQPRYVYDAGYGVRANQPRIATRHYVPGDYEVSITTNSAGMRGSREYSPDKPAGVRRVLVLGDSFAFGYGVEDDEVVSARLESGLNDGRNTGTRYEVLNLAVSGFGQAEELVTYRARGRAYRPDIVPFFYFENDIGNNAVANLFRLDENGALEPAAAEFLPGVRTREILYLFPPIRWLFEHSQAWNLVRNRLSGIVQNSLLRKQGLEKFNDTSRKGIDLTRALLGQLVGEIRADGAVPVVVIIPDRKEMDSTFPFSPAEVEALGARLLDGREYLVRADYYNRDSHWRPVGHEKTAARLLPLVREIAP